MGNKRAISLGVHPPPGGTGSSLVLLYGMGRLALSHSNFVVEWMTLKTTHNCEEVFQVRCRLFCDHQVTLLDITAKVAHKIYGIPQTINSANYVYFKAYQELFALRSGVGVDEAPSPSGPKERLIPFKELDRIVTGRSDSTACAQIAHVVFNTIS